MATAIEARNDFATVVVNGKTVGVGLKWEQITEGRDPKRAAKQYGKEHGYLLVTLCRSVVEGNDGEAQVSAGYVRKEQAPAKFKNLYCLSTLVGSVLGPNYIAAFELGEGRYATAIGRNGLVIPGYGDRVCSADEARKLINDFLSRFMSAQSGVKPALVCPSEFGLGDDNRTLSELLPAKAFKRQFRLDPVAASFDPKVLVWGGLAGATLIVGAGVFKRYASERAAQQEREREVAAALATKSEKTVAAVEKKQALPRPWISQPGAQALLKACRGILDETPLSMGGWLLTEVRCESNQVSATYEKQDEAPIGWFVDAVRAHTGGNLPVLASDGAHGAMKAAIQLQADDSDQLQPTPDLQFAMQDYLQRIGNGTFRADATTRPPNDTPPPTWSSTPFAIEAVTLPPEQLLADLDLAGLRITTITTKLDATQAELTWKIEGTIYGR